MLSVPKPTTTLLSVILVSFAIVQALAQSSTSTIPSDTSSTDVLTFTTTISPGSIATVTTTIGVTHVTPSPPLSITSGFSSAPLPTGSLISIPPAPSFTSILPESSSVIPTGSTPTISVTGLSTIGISTSGISTSGNGLSTSSTSAVSTSATTSGAGSICSIQGLGGVLGIGFSVALILASQSIF